MKPLTNMEESILLSVYHLKDNAYLISIRDYLKENAGISLAFGSVFAPLDRMRRNGLLNAVNGEPSQKVGGRAIKYYYLTEQGITALEERQKVLSNMWIGFDTNNVHGIDG